MREHLPRLAAEFVIVFLSVVLALLADDWRATRDDRSRERQVLELLLRDLEADAEDLRVFGERFLPDNIEGDANFIRGVESGVDADSLVVLVADALGIWNYRPTYPTWDGLLADGSVGLIHDPELRAAIVDYHSDDLDYLNDLLESRRSAMEAAERRLFLHFGRRPGDGLDQWEWVLRTSPEAVRADVELLNLTGESGRARAWVMQRIDEIFIPANADLQARLRTALDGA